jgi:hypothetical protein
MDVFTPAQRESHIQATIELVQSLQSVQGIEGGYEFQFPNESELIYKLADFISNERLCCPFLKFSFMVSASHEPISLSLTGPDGTQEFLRAEFAGAFS